MPKRKFIDKKNAVTFHLVHRSQQDPLTADENAPQRVLLPVTTKSSDKRFEEQRKYGIFFDDDYNYLQHLRDVNPTVEWVETEKSSPNVTTSKLKLPSSVFASNVEEDVGLLNKAAPTSSIQLHLDPDIVAAMDEDFNYEDPENQLEDNFIEFANAECSEDDEEYGSNVDSNFSEEELDDVASLDGGQFTFKDEETKSRFTEYSMTSSVIRRNNQLTLLDDRFEKMYAAYDDNEMGPLDCDEIEGHISESSNLLLQYADEFEREQKLEKLDKDDLQKRIQMQDEDDDSIDDLVSMEVVPKEKWDCESVLSTYSNLYNHPKLIKEPSKIKINPKTGIPMNILDSNRLTLKTLNKFNEQNNGYENKGAKSVGAQSILSNLSTLSIRPKGESSEERRERKKLLKDYRKERRFEKKANKEAFKEESKRQIKINMNNKNNIQGNRIL